jgi:hypothetical protein
MKLLNQSPGGVTIGLFNGLTQLASWDYEKSEIDDDIEYVDLQGTALNLMRVMHKDKDQATCLTLLTVGVELPL